MASTAPARGTPGQSAGVRLLLWLEFCNVNSRETRLVRPRTACRRLESSRGVVLSRAATILRSIETQPLTGGCLGRERYRGTTFAVEEYRAREKSEKCTGEEFSFSCLKQCELYGGRIFFWASLLKSVCLLSSSPLLANSMNCLQFLMRTQKPSSAQLEAISSARPPCYPHR